MNLKKRFLILMLSCLFIFTVGCGSKVNTTASNTKNQTNSSVKADSTSTNSDISTNTNDKTKDNKNAKDKSEQSKNDNKQVKEGKSITNTNSKNEIKKSNSKTSMTNQSNKKDAKATKNIAKSQTNKNDNTFTIILSEEEKGYTNSPSKRITSKTVPLDTNKSAMNYLREYFNARDKGGFIYELNGIHNEYPYHVRNAREKKLGILGYDWFIYLNGTKTPVGANDVYMKKGDILQLDIHRWDKREFRP